MSDRPRNSSVTPDRTRPEGPDPHPIDALDEEALDRVTAGAIGLAAVALPVAAYVGDFHPNGEILIGSVAAIFVLVGGYVFRYPWIEGGIFLESWLWKQLPPVFNVLLGLLLFGSGVALIVGIALA